MIKEILAFYANQLGQVYDLSRDTLSCSDTARGSLCESIVEQLGVLAVNAQQMLDRQESMEELESTISDLQDEQQDAIRIA